MTERHLMGDPSNHTKQGRYHYCRLDRPICQAYASSLRAKEALEGGGHDTAVQLQEEDEE